MLSVRFFWHTAFISITYWTIKELPGSFFTPGLDEITIQSTTTNLAATEIMKCVPMAVPIHVVFCFTLFVGGVRLPNVWRIIAAVLVQTKISQER